MKKWEYMTLESGAPGYLTKPVKERIVQLGDEGWELVQILPYGSGISLIFKREKLPGQL